MEQNVDPGQVILIDKPLRWTSFDAVKKIRAGLKIKKIGHAGTLDPLATGLLILCTGKKTKEIESYQAQTKEYTGCLILGSTTASFDLETEVVKTGDYATLNQAMIMEAASGFVGEQAQMPPMHSAVRVNGVRLYKLARKGTEVEVKPRQIHIYDFEITHIRLPEIGFRIKCSKGTYIRSIARDFGEKLGVGAYLSELRRTKIGDFDVANALNPEQYVELVKKQRE
jgi:tRNA pseudouridine55 synthase